MRDFFFFKFWCKSLLVLKVKKLLLQKQNRRIFIYLWIKTCNSVIDFSICSFLQTSHVHFLTLGLYAYLIINLIFNTKSNTECKKKKTKKHFFRILTFWNLDSSRNFFFLRAQKTFVIKVVFVFILLINLIILSLTLVLL